MSVLRRMAAPGATVHDWAIDLSLAVGLALACAGPYAALMIRYAGTGLETLPAEFITSLAMVLPIALRRHYPLLMMILVALAGVAQVAFVPRPVAGIVALPLVVYSVARWVPGHNARLVVLLGWLGAVIGPARWFLSGNQGTPTTILASLLTTLIAMGLILTPYAIGRRLRDAANARQAQLDSAAERYRMLLAERDQQARVNEVQSRNLIARELHDIVAHSLSVMIVQAEGGKALAARRPEAAAEVLGTIAETGREALRETRRILAVLRRETDGQVDFTPQPGLVELSQMVRKAGAHFREVGERPQVPPVVGLTAFRVAQEALTNVLKHAGPEAQADVTVTYAPAAISVEVVDNGRGAQAAWDGRGYGLRGMAERVAAMGGHLVAEPITKGRGFRVLAQLPIAPALPKPAEQPADESGPRAATRSPEPPPELPLDDTGGLAASLGDSELQSRVESMEAATEAAEGDPQ